MSIVLGRVLGPHGVRGMVRVKVMGDGPANMTAVETVTLAEDERGSAARHYRIEGGGTGRVGEARLKLEGVGSREAAQALRGRWIIGEESQLERLPEGEFYWFQLIGCRVETEDGDAVGTVKELWETGGHDVLVVRTEAGRQLLLPTAKELLPVIDIENKRLVVASLDGLLEPA